MSPPSRRATLRALGLAVASTAGCLGAGSDGSSETHESPTASPTPAPARTLAVGERFETTDGRTVRVADVAVHPSVVTVDVVSSTHWYERVTDAEDGQYVAFTVETTGFEFTDYEDVRGQPIPLPLAVAVDGERHGDPITVGRDRTRARDRVAVAVPVTDAAEAAVVWQRDEDPEPRWELSDATRARLAARPAFEVRSWSVPDRVEYGETFEASVTVANVGDRPGRFLATLGVKQGSLGVPETSVAVPAGETTTHAVAVEPHYYEGVESLRVVFDWGVDRREATVTVTGGDGTETGTPPPS